jgi:hypothetical protein
MSVAIRISLFLLSSALIVFLAETERIPWLVGLGALAIAAMVAIYHSRIKGVKVAGTEIELFEKRAEEISKTQIDAIKSEATAQREALEKLIETAKESERRLDDLTKRVLPRNFDHGAFDQALVGQPKFRVEIMFVKDDPDSFRLSLEIRSALRRSNWDALEPLPIPIIDSQLPSAMAVGGSPWGVTVIANQITVGEVKHETIPRTPYMILFYAIKAAMGQCSGCPIRNGHLSEGTLRIVVAPKQT